MALNIGSTWHTTSMPPRGAVVVLVERAEMANAIFYLGFRFFMSLFCESDQFLVSLPPTACGCSGHQRFRKTKAHCCMKSLPVGAESFQASGGLLPRRDALSV